MSAWQAAQEEARCARAGCALSLADGAAYCSEHHEDQKRRARESAARRRERWEAEQLCTRCGGVRYQGRALCRMCLKSLGRITEDVVDNVIDKPRTVRTVRRLEQSPDGKPRLRTRYVGQGKRGRRPQSDLDREDLEAAIKALALGSDGLRYWRQVDAERQIPRVQRDDVKHQALAKLVQAGRWIVEVIKRHGYEVPVAVDD